MVGLLAHLRFSMVPAVPKIAQCLETADGSIEWRLRGAMFFLEAITLDVVGSLHAVVGASICLGEGLLVPEANYVSTRHGDFELGNTDLSRGAEVTLICLGAHLCRHARWCNFKRRP